MFRIHALDPVTSGKLHRGLSLGVIAFTLFSWIGYALFVQHPWTLTLSPLFPPIFNVAFGVFAQVHVLLCFALVAVSLIKAQGTRWLSSLLLVFAVCFVAELGGTTIGVPFGLYEYTALLGPKILGHVPVLIPMSWFAVAACAHALGYHRFAHRPGLRILVTALALVFWDLSLDPSMSSLFKYWVWTTKGDYYYGMPLINLGGWFLTGLAVGGCLEWTELRRDLNRVSAREWVYNYALIVSLSLGFLVLGQMWTALVVSALAYGGSYLALRERLPVKIFEQPHAGQVH